MTVETALRLTDLLLAWALLQASLEHFRDPALRPILAARAALAILLASGLASGLAGLGLLAVGLFLLHRYNGPYNGGSDRMALLTLVALTAAHLAPTAAWRELALGYLAVQVVLSYVISGWVKIVNPEWRTGQALVDVFAFSAYPVSEGYRALALRPALLLAAGWGVMLFELAFPLGFLHPAALATALVLAALFHLANAVLFGLNRFFWTWIATYPALFWLQDRLVG